MPLSNATSATDKYRVKAYELLSLAERAGDPEQPADLLRFARMWMSLYGANRRPVASEIAA